MLWRSQRHHEGREENKNPHISTAWIQFAWEPSKHSESWSTDSCCWHYPPLSNTWIQHLMSQPGRWMSQRQSDKKTKQKGGFVLVDWEESAFLSLNCVNSAWTFPEAQRAGEAMGSPERQQSRKGPARNSPTSALESCPSTFLLIKMAFCEINKQNCRISLILNSLCSFSCRDMFHVSLTTP